MRAYHFHDVGMFHHKFGLDETTYSTAPGPRELPDQLLYFRVGFMCEELQEALEALGFTFDESLWEIIRGSRGIHYRGDGTIDHAKLFDSLIDLVYVIYGFAHLLGYPWEEGWNMVQAANMSKERAQRAEQSARGGTWDIIKPPGWQPPDIEALLRNHGWGRVEGNSAEDGDSSGVQPEGPSDYH